ncbi:MAG: tripartite tricarboxylate transporter substrate binding protein [Pseudomonadota bacterium]
MANESTRRELLRAAAAGSAMSLLTARHALAQAWPARNIRMVVPFAPGGSTDVVARLIAQRLGDALRQPVVVENKPGSGSVLGADLVAKAAPDGYTLVMAANSCIAPGPLMRSSMPYDPINDFVHIAMIGSFPNGFMVRADHPAKTMQEFIAMARAKPGSINYASAGIGTSGFLSGELLKQTAKLNMVHVPYKGSGPAIIELLGGQLDALFEGLVTATGYVKSGKLRLLAITSERRVKAFPEIPTLGEVVPGVSGAAWFGISAPAKTPAAVTERLQAEIQAIVQSPEMQTRLTDLGMTPMAYGAAEYLAFIQSENRKWAPVIKASNVKVD